MYKSPFIGPSRPKDVVSYMYRDHLPSVIYFSKSFTHIWFYWVRDKI